MYNGMVCVFVYVFVQERKCSSGFAVFQFLLRAGMYSLRMKVWICAPSHCPVAPVLQLSLQADR